MLRLIIKKSQLALFGGSREGETKPGKHGTLVLRRNRSGRGGHWEYQTQDVRREYQDKGISLQRAYDVLSGNLGCKVEIVDNVGDKDNGKFRLVNENSNGSLNLFLQTENEGEMIIPINKDKRIERKGDKIIFHFGNKQIIINTGEKVGKINLKDNAGSYLDKIANPTKKLVLAG